MPQETDVVVFRRWKDCGTLIALFPEIPTDLYGRYCEAYEHVGQHGGADFHGCIQNTVSVRPEEYADLAEELTTIGYNLAPSSGHRGTTTNGDDKRHGNTPR